MNIKIKNLIDYYNNLKKFKADEFLEDKEIINTLEFSLGEFPVEYLNDCCGNFEYREHVIKWLEGGRAESVEEFKDQVSYLGYEYLDNEDSIIKDALGNALDHDMEALEDLVVKLEK